MADNPANTTDTRQLLRDILNTAPSEQDGGVTLDASIIQRETTTEPQAVSEGRSAITMDDLRNNPQLREEGYTIGDTFARDAEGNITDLERVYSDGSLSERQGQRITAKMLRESPRLRRSNAQVGDTLLQDDEGNYSIRKRDIFNTYKQFMYGMDENGTDIRNWGDVLLANMPMSVRGVPLLGGGVLFTGGQFYMSPDEVWGEGFSEANGEQRRDMIIDARQRALLDEYGYDALDLEENKTTAQTIGSLASSLLTPTSVAPVGRGLGVAAGIGAALGAETVIAEQLAQTGEVQAAPVIGTAAIGGILGGTLGYVTKGAAVALTRRAQRVINEGKADNLSDADIARNLLAETNSTLDQIEGASRLAGTPLNVPGSQQAAEEALNSAIRNESAFSRLMSKSFDRYLGTLSTRIRNISEPVFGLLRKFEYRTHSNTAKYLARAKPFIEGFRGLEKGVKDRVSLNLFNRNYEQAARELDRVSPGLGNSLQSVRGIFDDIAKEMKETGAEFGELDNYFTRRVTDLEGLRNSFGKETLSILEEQKRKYARLLGKSSLTNEETEFANNKILEGYIVTPSAKGARWVYKPSQVKVSPNATKARSIDEITQDQLQYYMSPEAALELYIRRMVENTQMRRFFGGHEKADNIAQAADGLIDRDESIGRLLTREAGNLSREDSDKLKELLSSRFVGGAQSPGALTNLIRNTGYLGTIASPTAAITQLADLGASGAIYGLRNSLQAMFGAKSAKLIDIGLDEVISQEFTNPSLSGRMLSGFFKYTGFKAIDRLGKETIINASIKKAQSMAGTTAGRRALKRKWGAVFGDEFDSLADDLARGDVTDNVKFLAFNELSDMQPVTLSELPQAYLDNAGWRVLYMLKSFMLKQIDVVRRNIIQEWDKGNRVQAVKNAAVLWGYLATSNAGTGVIKDTILGREVRAEQLPNRAMWALLGIYGMDKYTSDRYLANGQITEAAKNMIVPATPIWDALFSVGSDVVKNEVDRDTMFKLVKVTPGGGNIVYSWLGGGAEEYNKRNQ